MGNWWGIEDKGFRKSGTESGRLPVPFLLS
jgi:hypothetical protein